MPWEDGQPFDQRKRAGGCRARYVYQNTDLDEEVTVRLGVLDDGRWWVCAGPVARAYPTEHAARTVAHNLMRQRPGLWTQLPCYPYDHDDARRVIEEFTVS